MLIGFSSLNSRSVTLTLAQMQQQQPETVVVDVSGRSKKGSNDSRGSNPMDSLVKAARKFQPREGLSDDEDSDTDVVSSEDEDDDLHTKNSNSSLERFLIAYDLEDYFPVCVKLIA